MIANDVHSAHAAEVGLVEIRSTSGGTAQVRYSGRRSNSSSVCTDPPRMTV